MTTAKSAPPAVEAQDPLPESNWFYRRILVFATAIYVGIAVAFIIRLFWLIGKRQPVEAIEALSGLATLLLVILIIDRLLYLVAPSAEQAGKWIATLSMLRAGGSITTRASSDGKTAEAETTVATEPKV